MPTDTYSIVDLARLTGVNVRTIRYYLAQGLLPASGESGPGSHYGQGHLDRLRLTKRLQQEHLPLAEIRTRLADLSDDEVADVVATPAAEPGSASTSALDYVRSVLAGDRSGIVLPPPPVMPVAAYSRATPPDAPPTPGPRIAPRAMSSPSAAPEDSVGVARLARGLV